MKNKIIRFLKKCLFEFDRVDKYANGYYIHTPHCPCCKINFAVDGGYDCVYGGIRETYKKSN